MTVTSPANRKASIPSRRLFTPSPDLVSPEVWNSSRATRTPSRKRKAVHTAPDRRRSQTVSFGVNVHEMAKLDELLEIMRGHVGKFGIIVTRSDVIRHLLKSAHRRFVAEKRRHQTPEGLVGLQSKTPPPRDKRSLRPRKADAKSLR